MPALHSFGKSQQEAVWRATCLGCDGSFVCQGPEPTPAYCWRCLKETGEARRLEWKLDDAGYG